MLSINKKNGYMTQKINIKLKKVKIRLINKTWMIK